MNREYWESGITPELLQNMEKLATKAYENGCDMLNDSRLLYDSERHARANALAILSEEEFSKAFIITICAKQKRWDSNIYGALMHHPEKQGIADGVKEYIDWFSKNYKTVMELNKVSFIPNQAASVPPQEIIDAILGKAKRQINNRNKDRFKQTAIYVNLNKKCEVTSTPNKITCSDALKAIEEASKFKAITEVLFGDDSNINEAFSSNN